MNNTILFIAFAVVTGLLIPVQAALNTQLNKYTASPVLTTLIFFIVGISATVLVWLITRPSLSAKTLNAPAYTYVGGLIVTTYALLIPVITPRLGVGASIGLVITGQLIGAIVIDHFGLLGMPVRPVNLTRIFGAACMIAGIYLVMGQTKH